MNGVRDVFTGADTSAPEFPLRITEKILRMAYEWQYANAVKQLKDNFDYLDNAVPPGMLLNPMRYGNGKIDRLDLSAAARNENLSQELRDACQFFIDNPDAFERLATSGDGDKTIISKRDVNTPICIKGVAYKGGKQLDEPVDLVTIGYGLRMEREAAAAYNAMVAAARKDGVILKPNSGYRTHEEQEKLYKKDKTKAERPGHSTHQAGIAVDIQLNPTKRNNLKSSEEYKWLCKNAAEHGFIPSELARDEPYHWIYVGKEEAKEWFADKNNQKQLNK